MTEQERRDQQRLNWKAKLAENAKLTRRRQTRPRRTGLASVSQVGMVRIRPRQDDQDGHEDGPNAA